jgi:hypothetical protein
MDRFATAKQNAQLVKVGGLVVDMMQDIGQDDAYLTIQEEYGGPGTCLVVLVRGEAGVITDLAEAIPKLVKRVRKRN